MGIFNFVKGIGEKLTGHHSDESTDDTAQPIAAPAAEPTAQQMANSLLARVQGLNLNISGLTINYNSDTDTAEIAGTAATQADREKAILAMGNVDHVKTVVDSIKVEDGQPESKMYTVQSGDTLSKIAKEEYGDANAYNKIFEANQPMLSSPDKIFVGQMLRIPA